MPFKETSRMEQRVRMLSEFDTGAFNVAELCARFGVCRDTFYDWKDRRASGEAEWFRDRSHAPLSCPHRTPEAVVKAVVAVKRRFPHFGPKKVRGHLVETQPGAAWPAASTIGEILKKEGLVEDRRPNHRLVEQGQTFTPARAANDEWCVDFKAWFRTGDGAKCDPLTISDAHSRYLFDVRITRPSIIGVWPWFEAAFQTYGLPGAIRSDNGTPFGSNGAGGLTRLSVWWIKLGIEPRFIAPASPHQNGRHERMHRTLEEHTASPPAKSLEQQQECFDRFRQHYNHERPHEALQQTTPARHWSRSLRDVPEQLLQPQYEDHLHVRRVRKNGEIKWAGGKLFVGDALVGELVGLLEYEPGRYLVRYFDIPLGVTDRSGRFLRFAPLRHRLREAQKARD